VISPEHIPFDEMAFQGYTIGKAFGMGQSGPIQDAWDKVKALVRDNALTLVAIGGAIGLLGSTVLKYGPFEMTVTVAGGVILAMGILPLILGVIG
jgi:hypothetical protein